MYLGGNAQSESDVGLSLSRVLVDVEKQTLSVGGIAFPPLLRYITAEDRTSAAMRPTTASTASQANGKQLLRQLSLRYTSTTICPATRCA